MVHKRITYLLPIVLSILMIYCGNPKIHFYERKHDFGNLVQHETVEHVFRFVNTGDGKLLIKKIKSG